MAVNKESLKQRLLISEEGDEFTHRLTDIKIKYIEISRNCSFENRRDGANIVAWYECGRKCCRDNCFREIYFRDSCYDCSHFTCYGDLRSPVKLCGIMKHSHYIVAQIDRYDNPERHMKKLEKMLNEIIEEAKKNEFPEEEIFSEEEKNLFWS